MTLPAEAAARVDVTATTLTLLGQWLEEVRLSRRQMRRDACREAGISRPTWHRLVWGEDRGLYRPTLESLAVYLDVDPDTVRLLASLPAGPGFAPCDKAGRAARSEARDASGLPYPTRTWIGVKLHPTFPWDRGCSSCPVLGPCRRDVVERDGFAWCEELLPVDLDVDEQTLSRRSMYYQEGEDW